MIGRIKKEIAKDAAKYITINHQREGHVLLGVKILTEMVSFAKIRT